MNRWTVMWRWRVAVALLGIALASVSILGLVAFGDFQETAEPHRSDGMILLMFAGGAFLGVSMVGGAIFAEWED